jgi:hypothetical protein
MTAPYVVIIVLELALVIKVSNLIRAQYKENRRLKEISRLELLIEIERLNEMIWDLTEGRGY